MSDLIVRDHSKPCEHGVWMIGHKIETSTDENSDWCPGGREIVLRRTFLFKKPVGADLFDGATLVEAWMEAEEA